MSSMGMLTVFIVVGLGEAKDLFANKKFTIKPVIGGFVLGVLLFALEAWNNELATRIDTLIIIGALLVDGSAVTNALTIPANLKPLSQVSPTREQQQHTQG